VFLFVLVVLLAALVVLVCGNGSTVGIGHIFVTIGTAGTGCTGCTGKYLSIRNNY